MAKEIERKFLVDKQKIFQIKPDKTLKITQGYLSANALNTVRVRIADSKAYITIKGKTKGISRDEYEYEIPIADAQDMLTLVIAKPIVKNRHIFVVENKKWEVDEFLEDNSGLIVAEIELKTESELFAKPDWILSEVTYDCRYRNTYLSQKPYSKW